MIASAAAAATVLLGLGAGSAYAAPGEFDNTWGTGGALILPSPNATDDAWDVAVQPDGKIVVAGDSGNDAIVWRYTQAGVPDPDFNGGAPLLVDSGGSEIAFEIAFAPDNKIVVAGQTSNGSDGVVYRINTNGTLDTLGFGGGDGRVEVGLPGGFIQITGVAVQSDNKIVAIGQSGSTTNAVVWRFEPSGAPDLSFDDDGIQEVDAGGNETGQSVAIASDGGIIGSGNTSVATNGFVFRLDPATGDLDTAGFSGDGKQEIDSGGSEQLLGMGLQPDGKIVVTGLTSVNNDGTVYRINPNGSPDNSFDNDSAFGLDSGGTESAQDVAFQPDGKLVVVGSTSVNSSGVIYRVNANGGLDSTFDNDGALGFDNGGSESGLGVALQADRKILMAGFTNNPATSGYVTRVLGDDPIVTPPQPGQKAKKKKCKKKKKKKGKAAAKKCKKKKKKKK